MLTLSLGFGLSKKSNTINQSDYFADNGGTFAWYSAPMGDKAVYDAATNKTWTVYEGWDGRRHVAYVNLFNHSTNQWEGAYKVVPSLIKNDDHGVQFLHMDSNGYVHLTSGLHGGNIFTYVTENPRDPTSWVYRQTINGKHTYAHVLEPSAENFVLVSRVSYNTYQNGSIILSTAYSNGAITWGTSREFAEPGEGYRFYRGNCVVVSGKIHMVATVSDIQDVWRRDIYYLIYDPATDQIENIQGTRVDAAANWPISYANLDAHYRIYEHDDSDPEAANQYAGSLPVVVINNNNYPEVFFYNGLVTGAGQYGGGFGDMDILHMSWNGSAWSSPVSVGQSNQKYEEFYASHLGGGDLELLYPDTSESSNIRGGNIASRKRISGVWQDPVAVKSYEYPRGLDRCIATNKATDKLRFMFLEGAPSQDIDGIAISDDVKAGYQRIYAYGSSGLIKRPFTRTISLSASTISAGRSVGDIVSIIHGDHPRYTYTITNDPNSAFTIDGKYLRLSDTISAGTYPVTIQGTFRDVTVSQLFTLTCVAANSLEDKKLAEYKLDEGSGNTIIDSSYYGQNGVLGETGITTSASPAWDSEGLVFGVQHRKTTTPYSDLFNVTGFHVIAYVKNTGSTVARIVSTDSYHQADRKWALTSQGYKLSLRCYNGATIVLNMQTASDVLTINTWHRVEAIVNGTDAEIIVDGNSVATGTLSAGLNADLAADLSLGSPFSFNETYNGKIGYFCQYNQELTGAELTAARSAADSAMTNKGVSL